MKPTLLALRLGETDIQVPSYGVAVSLGIALAILLAARQAKRVGLDQGEILDLSFWLLVAGVGGSRVMFVLLNAGDFARLCADGAGAAGGVRSTSIVLRDCAAPLRVWDGGLVFYGGALAAAVVAWRFGKSRGWSFPVLGDVFAPGIALGHAVGRIGCFLAGCCFGTPCQGQTCVVFPPGSVAHDHLVAQGTIPQSASLTPPLHPTQLYESAALLAVFTVLTLLGPRKRFHGQVLLVYVITYATLRLALELLRGDLTRKFLLPHVSTSQAVSLALIAAATIALLKGRRRTE